MMAQGCLLSVEFPSGVKVAAHSLAVLPFVANMVATAWPVPIRLFDLIPGASRVEKTSSDEQTTNEMTSGAEMTSSDETTSNDEQTSGAEMTSLDERTSGDEKRLAMRRPLAR